jgi:hypothetical protein
MVVLSGQAHYLLAKIIHFLFTLQVFLFFIEKKSRTSCGSFGVSSVRMILLLVVLLQSISSAEADEQKSTSANRNSVLVASLAVLRQSEV